MYPEFISVYRNLYSINSLINHTLYYNTMRYTDYIPSNDKNFIDFAKNLRNCAIAGHEKWMIPHPKEFFGDSLDDFVAKHDLTLNPNCGKMDFAHKTTARKGTEKSVRNYVQGFLAKNVLVSDDERREMRITVSDAKPSPVGDPVGLVTATVKYLNEGALELRIEHVESTPYDDRANYGVRIAYDVFPVGESAPEGVDQLRRSNFTRRKRELITFDDSDLRKVAWFRLRYENSKGRAGQWGPMFSAIIP